MRLNLAAKGRARGMKQVEDGGFISRKWSRESRREGRYRLAFDGAPRGWNGMKVENQ